MICLCQQSNRDTGAANDSYNSNVIVTTTTATVTISDDGNNDNANNHFEKFK